MNRGALVSLAVGCLVVAGCGAGAAPIAAPAAVSSTAPAASPSRVVSRPAAQALIKQTTWTTTDKGRQLQVIPTIAGRRDLVPGDEKRAWAEVLAKAPDAGSPGMYDQFLCHWNYARVVEPDKPSWNLEPWRPAVGYAKTVAALCNPGGPES